MGHRLLPDGITTSAIYHNLSYDEIFNHEQTNHETTLTSQGAMSIDTGIFHGRSPKDKYIVKIPGSKSDKHINWGSVNMPVEEAAFDILLARAQKHLSNKTLYVFDGYAGARPSTRMKIRVVSEKAWQHHFVTNMFIRPTEKELEEFGTPDFTIINAAAVTMTQEEVSKFKLNSEVAAIFHLEKNIAVISGTWYGGEMKKGIFSVMNFLKPLDGILTMHCSANVSKTDGHSALFFGLSGTGKTTLSTDSNRPIVGDDEHGWDDEGIWNLEGGCYAKTINLDAASEPEIWRAIKKGALLENVVIVNGEVDYTNPLKTENTRVSYPIFHLENRVEPSIAPHPQHIIFLSADAFGVLPPVSRLTPEQASYHFLSGYTSKLAGTERGVTTPQTTFSTCFGGPFMTLKPTVYADLLVKKMKEHNVKAWLVNTGWNGEGVESGADGKPGKRMPIKLTRAIISGIFTGELEKANFKKDEVLNLEFPLKLGQYGEELLDPSSTWKDKSKYEAARKSLASEFIKNSEKYINFDPKFKDYGPKV